MTKELLIVTLIMILIIVICPVITVLVLSKDEKNKELFNKILKVTTVVDLVVLVILVSLWIDPIKNNNLTVEKTTKKEETISGDELSNAGFKELSINEYLELVKKDEKNIILVARPTCGYCQKFTPVLKEAAEDMNLTINYVNTDNFSEEDWEKFNSSLIYLNSEEWGTPLTLIVQNGEVVAENNGYVDLDAIKKFFTDNGFGA